MLANMRVGTKLAAILLAPLVVLAVLAGLGIAERAGRASDLRAAEHDAAAAVAVSELQFALEVEQLWGLSRLTGDDGQSVRNYQDAAAGTDQAAEVLRRAIRNLEDTTADVKDRIESVADRLTAVTVLRGDVTSGDAALNDVLFRYDQAGEALVGLVAATVANQLVPDIAADLGFAVTLSRAHAAQARGSALLLARNGLRNSEATLAEREQLGEVDAALAQSEAEAERFYAQFFGEADAEFRSLLRNAQASSEARLSEAFRQQIIAGQPVDPAAVAATAIAELAATQALTGEIDEHTAEEAAEERGKATRIAQLYLLGAGLGILLAVALAFLVARSITRPLRRLTQAADRISTEQLPALVSQLQAGASESGGYEPIDIKSRDEIGQLAVAFNTLQQVTVDVAQEQGALLRRGIGDIFVNLARRNQALLDRQIEFIDQLEANERDPDQLENLFRLDHLATRMRRNAESLLVLAGAETTRRRGRPVSLGDVVRVAVGEVADYSRLRVRTLDEVRVSAAVAVDLAHLLAELMENATQFSPPTTSVEVQGGFDAQGQYVITVTDRGIGIQDSQLAEFNELLARPPLMGLEMSRSLGFVVIGRLAQRHGVAVRLHAAPIHGVSAAIRLPASALGVGTSGAADQGGAETRRGQTSTAPGSREDAATGNGPFDQAAVPPGLVSPGGLRRRGGSGYSAGQTGSTGSALVGGLDGPSSEGSRSAAGGLGLRGSSANGSGAPGSEANGAGFGQRRAGGASPSPESFTYYEVAEDLNAPTGVEEADGPGGLPSRRRAEPVGTGGPALQSVQPPPPNGMGPATVADFTETERDVVEEGTSAFPSLVLPTPAAPMPPLPSRRHAAEANPSPAASTASARPGLDAGVVPAQSPVPRAPSMFSSASMAAATPATSPAPPAALPTDGAVPTGRASGGAAWAPDATAGRQPEGATSLSPLPSRRPGMRAFESDQPGTPVQTERMRDLVDDAAEAEAEAAFARGLATSTEETPAVGLLPSGLPGRRPAPLAGDADSPAGLPTRPASSAASLVPANGGEGLTAAGLVRRSPKQQLRAMARGEPAAPTRVMATQRSPEEVRKMLSRYRSGLERGRTPGVDVADGPLHAPEGSPPTGSPSPGQPGGLSPEKSTEHAAEESPWRN